MDIFFNECSLEVAPTITAACNNVDALVKTIVAARRPGMRVIFGEEFLSVFVADGYSMGRWMEDRNVDIETRRLMKALLQKAPNLEAYFIEMSLGSLTEATVTDQPVKGLGAAAICGSPSLSFATHPWTRDPIRVCLRRLDNDAELHEEFVDTTNLFSEDVARAREEWLNKQMIQTFKTGEVLLEKAGLDFDNIEFTENAASQLRALRGGETVFPHVVRHILALGHRTLEWVESGGAFTAALDVRWSDESDATVGKYGAERTFTLRSGERRLFRLHTKIGPEAWRIYFCVAEDDSKVIVGYVGKHLSTVRDP